MLSNHNGHSEFFVGSHEKVLKSRRFHEKVLRSRRSAGRSDTTGAGAAARLLARNCCEVWIISQPRFSAPKLGGKVLFVIVRSVRSYLHICHTF